ncbi:MAG: hypothetical protein ACKVOA_00240 [Methylophilaceae bacterium]
MTSRTYLLLRILAYTIFICLFLFVWDSDFGYTYRKHFLSHSHLVLDFNDLDANTTEADIKKRYPINWYCGNDSSVPYFGDYFCADELKTWDNFSALTVVFWFKNGKLNAGKIDFPLWEHKSVISHLKEKYGAPKYLTENENTAKAIKNIALFLVTSGKYNTDDDIFNDELGVWYLTKHTQISTSLDNESNILGHNTILWQVY